MISRKARYAWIALLIFTVWLVSFPRFNRQDLGPIKRFTGKIDGRQSLGDATYYIDYVRFFRGEGSIEEVDLPFRYRPLIPFIASLLPVESPMTSLNLINLAALLVTILILFRLFRRFGFDFGYSMAGCFLYAVSFPVFYLSTTGYLEACTMCLLAAGTYFIYRERLLPVAVIIALGTLIKEVTVLLIPVAIAYAYAGGSSRRRLLARSLLLALGFVVPVVAVKLLFRGAGDFYWIPSFQTLIDNLRLRAALSLLLSFGLPGVISVFSLVQFRRMTGLVGLRLLMPLLAGICFTALLVLYSMLTAYTDGRFIWPMTIYTIPLALWVVRFGFGERAAAHLNKWRKHLSANLNSFIM